MFPPETRVQVVDDLPNQQSFVRMELRAAGISGVILMASNGKEAMASVVEQLVKGTPIDLIVSDWEMPVMSGVEFVKALRADPRFGTSPVIMVTAMNRQEDILKPFTRAQLIEKLNKTWESLRKDD